MNQSSETLLSKKKFSYDDVVELLRLLRSDNGCPWDRAQTHESIRSNAVEEAYELVDAIDKGDSSMMTEEIGDLLLQCVFHMNIAESEGEFTSQDVYTALCNKLISRHTHIFGKDKASDAAEALTTWEKNKLATDKIETTTEYMNKIPKHFPSLMRAYKIQKRAAKVGFDWDNAEDAFKKVNEEMSEVIDAIPEGNQEHLEEEIGDALFALVNVSRFVQVEPETALNRANEKFVRRFDYIEQRLAEVGKKPSDSTLEEMDALWNESKKRGL